MRVRLRTGVQNVSPTATPFVTKKLPQIPYFFHSGWLCLHREWGGREVKEEEGTSQLAYQPHNDKLTQASLLPPLITLPVIPT